MAHQVSQPLFWRQSLLRPEVKPGLKSQACQKPPSHSYLTANLGWSPAINHSRERLWPQPPLSLKCAVLCCMRKSFAAWFNEPSEEPVDLMTCENINLLAPRAVNLERLSIIHLLFQPQSQTPPQPNPTKTSSNPFANHNLTENWTPWAIFRVVWSMLSEHLWQENWLKLGHNRILNTHNFLHIKIDGRTFGIKDAVIDSNLIYEKDGNLHYISVGGGNTNSFFANCQ